MYKKLQWSEITLLRLLFIQRDDDGKNAIERKHARQLLEKQSQWWLNTFAERQLKLGDKSIEPLFFRIRIDSMTGLRASDKIGDINAVN